MGFVHAAVNPAGAKLPQGFPEVFTAGDGNGRRQNLLADSVRRQEGKRKVMAPDGGAVACRQFILEGKSLNAIPLFLLGDQVSDQAADGVVADLVLKEHIVNGVQHALIMVHMRFTQKLLHAPVLPADIR